MSTYWANSFWSFYCYGQPPLYAYVLQRHGSANKAAVNEREWHRRNKERNGTKYRATTECREDAKIDTPTVVCHSNQRLYNQLSFSALLPRWLRWPSRGPLALQPCSASPARVGCVDRPGTGCATVWSSSVRHTCSRIIWWGMFIVNSLVHTSSRSRSDFVQQQPELMTIPAFGKALRVFHRYARVCRMYMYSQQSWIKIRWRKCALGFCILWSGLK